MVLTIKAISYKGQPLISPIEAVFDEQGGTLGRSPRNHLVLMDNEKVVSGEHGTITYENGNYYYIDTSLNGTRVTNRNQRIHHQKIRLKDDDMLQVGEYRLVLSISGNSIHPSSHHPQPAQDPLSLAMFDHDGPESREPQMSDILGNNGLSDRDENINAYETPEFHSAFSNDQSASLDDSFVPPEPVGIAPQEGNSPFPADLTLDDFFGSDTGSKLTAAGAKGRQVPIPDDKRSRDRSIPWKEGYKDFSRSPESPASMGRKAEQVPSVPPANGQPVLTAKNSRPSTGEVSAELLRELFMAAGIEETGVYTSEERSKLMRSIGSILRELVDGLMTVLRGRSELKSQLRVSMTTLKPVENNPLKFSPSVEEALKSCLLNKHPGFINAVDAIHEGYEDIKNHQLAITAGIQASLVNILKRFDPQRFSEKFSEGLVLQKKAKCWDEYRQAYRQIVEEALEDFFGEVFVRAYEEQIDKLRTRKNKTI
ncbi:MAG: type VI secretion system-associated FHA domain protein TagH [Desulfobacteraceae bacterium]|jgi:type VI secretion system FHA domain protein